MCMGNIEKLRVDAAIDGLGDPMSRGCLGGKGSVEVTLSRGRGGISWSGDNVWLHWPASRWAPILNRSGAEMKRWAGADLRFVAIFAWGLGS